METLKRFAFTKPWLGFEKVKMILEQLLMFFTPVFFLSFSFTFLFYCFLFFPSLIFSKIFWQFCFYQSIETRRYSTHFKHRCLYSNQEIVLKKKKKEHWLSGYELSHCLYIFFFLLFFYLFIKTSIVVLATFLSSENPNKVLSKPKRFNNDFPL